jgi:hypothetical protein
MKTALLILLMMGSQLALAGELVLRDGTVYRNVVIISADPERMLVVHDGGGCQVEYAGLEQDSLTPVQRSQIEGFLKKHVERQARLEELRLEKEAFEQTQLAKGLIKFEGNWMTPADQHKILTMREVARLERERLALELEQKKIELRTAELKAREGDQLLQDRQSSSFIYYTGRNYPNFGRNGCYDPSHFSGSWNRRRPAGGGLHIGSDSSFSYGIR